MAAAATAVAKEKVVKLDDTDILEMSNQDLYGALVKARRVGQRLDGSVGLASKALLVLAVLAVVALWMRPDPDRLAVDPANRIYPIEAMAAGDPPESKVTLFVKDCMSGVLNGTFTDYDRTINRSIGECFTAAGQDSVTPVIAPFLANMKRDRKNLTSQYVVTPFTKLRLGSSLSNRVWKVQGIVAVGYRGQNVNTQPILYAFEASVVRVPYWSSVQGIRLDQIQFQQRQQQHQV